MIHSSTLAHSSFYRKLGLQRITGSCDFQVDQTICENTSAALEQVKSAIDLAHTRRADPLHDNALHDAALSLLQLLLLQVCAKPTELVGVSNDLADRTRAPGA